MTASNKEFDLNKLSSLISENLGEHEENIATLCMRTNVIPLEDFYSGYEREVKKIESQLMPEKETLNIQTLTEAFKSLHAYPTNLRIPKEKVLTNAGKKNRDKLNIVPEIVNDYVSEKIDGIEMLAEHTSCIEALNDYKIFRQKLDKLSDELNKQDIATEYVTKLSQLASFAAELEKIMPADPLTVVGFDVVEGDKLNRLAKWAEDLAFIQTNQKFLINVKENNDTRLKSIIELISYTLSSITGAISFHLMK